MTPNWIHNSGKKKNPKGVSKGCIKARKQVLQHLKEKYKVVKWFINILYKQQQHLSD